MLNDFLQKSQKRNFTRNFKIFRNIFSEIWAKNYFFKVISKLSAFLRNVDIFGKIGQKTIFRSDL